MELSPYHKEMFDKLLECNICLGRLDNPKTLHCMHSFCQSCLDDVIEFKLDGSAVIHCPLRCCEETIIAKDKTTNDLKATVQLKNVVEFLSETQKRTAYPKDGHKDPENNDCKYPITFYCLVCQMKLCNNCSQAHCVDKIDHSLQSINNGPQTNNNRPQTRCISVRYDPKNENELLPWCETHSTFARYLCDGSQFACNYCIARTHTQKQHKKIDEKFEDIAKLLQLQFLREGVYCTICSVPCGAGSNPVASYYEEQAELCAPFIDIANDELKIEYLYDLIQKENTDLFTRLLPVVPKELLRRQTKIGDGCTLFHIVVVSKNIRLISAMLSVGVDINCDDKDGDTALHYVADQGNLALVKLLVQHNANIMHKNKQGMNAIDVAKSSMHRDTVTYLLNKCEEWNLRDDGMYGQMTMKEMGLQELVTTRYDWWRRIKGKMR